MADTTPAYPRTGYYNANNPENNNTPQDGLLIVDLFAMEAFKAIYAIEASKSTHQNPLDVASLCSEAYVIAASMIEARNEYLTPPAP